MSSSILGIILVSLALAYVAPASAIGNDLIQKVCNATRYKDLCISTLEDDPKSASADVRDLAFIAQQAAFRDVDNISSLIYEKISTNQDPFLQQSYNDCTENYVAASDKISEAYRPLEEKRYNDANKLVTAAMREVGLCIKGFNRKQGSDTTVVDRSKNFYKLCSNVLDIIKQIKG